MQIDQVNRGLDDATITLIMYKNILKVQISRKAFIF